MANEVVSIDRYVPDYKHECEVCGADHAVTGVKDGKVVYQTSMCGVCIWGESDMLDPGAWNK
jgi:transcription elongation factor Elf1